jgi:hypothetical protein
MTYKSFEESDSSSFWVTTGECSKLVRRSRSTLYRLRDEKILIPGKHYVRKNPKRPKSDLLWHFDEILKTLQGWGRGK